MYTDAWKETFERAEIQGKPVLFTPYRVLPETVPEKWFRYELRGRGRDFEVPRYLEKEVTVDFVGTVLSPERFALNCGRLNIEGDFERLHEAMTVSDFCKAQHLPEPQDTRKYIPRPASAEENEAGVFYAMNPEQDEALGVAGHVRIDFGYQGKQFHHSWWPRGPEALNTPEFKAELGKVVDELRRGPLKSLQDMRRFCHANGGEINGGMLGQNYGYVIETERYNRYFVVDTYQPNVEEFIGQVRETYEALGLIDKSQYTSLSGVDLNGKVLVLSPDTLKEEYWTPKAQLWYAKGGFGCSPTARGRAVLATCIDDGETVFWNRQDFDGVLDEKYLPDWAKDKLQELRNPAPEQDQGMGGMEMK